MGLCMGYRSYRESGAIIVLTIIPELYNGARVSSSSPLLRPFLLTKRAGCSLTPAHGCCCCNQRSAVASTSTSGVTRRSSLDFALLKEGAIDARAAPQLGAGGARTWSSAVIDVPCFIIQKRPNPGRITELAGIAQCSKCNFGAQTTIRRCTDNRLSVIHKVFRPELTRLAYFIYWLAGPDFANGLHRHACRLATI